MNKKATIKDIAQAAGVSAATVSYVISGREDQKISEPVRKRILHLANLMNYTPSRSAQLLRGGKTGILTLRAGCDEPLRRADTLDFLARLSLAARSRGWELTFSFSTAPEKIEHADAAICLDFSEEAFLSLGDENFIPLLGVQCLVKEALFFQVNTDYSRFDAPGRFVTLCPKNEALRLRLLSQRPDAVLIQSLAELTELPGGDIVTDSPAIAKALSALGRAAEYRDDAAPERLETILACVEKSLSRKEFEQHLYFV
ncbi:MAG: LacI family DNA-binding transcriptional regulator [Oscillospiraceae bacterium]|nr:LacI family DNA-binding transcriptional regulator [Oscillospiraceae bacterium]